jgi:hypothetical protein
VPELNLTYGQTFVEYIGRIFGWDGRTVMSRLAAAQKLEQLPLLSKSLREGTVSWSFAREVSRIAEPHTTGSTSRASSSRPKASASSTKRSSRRWPGLRA